MIRKNLRLACKRGHFGTVGDDPGPRAVPRSPYADDATRPARQLDLLDGRGRLQDRLCPAVARWPCADRLGLCPLLRCWYVERLDAADIAKAHHGRADAAGGDPGGGVLYSRSNLCHAEAPDAGRDQAVGCWACPRRWRARLVRPVRFVPGLGGIRPHL